MVTSTMLSCMYLYIRDDPNALSSLFAHMYYNYNVCRPLDGHFVIVQEMQ